jgi:hypothetical protein
MVSEFPNQKKQLSDKMLIFSVLEQILILTRQKWNKSNNTIEFMAGKTGFFI